MYNWYNKKCTHHHHYTKSFHLIIEMNIVLHLSHNSPTKIPLFKLYIQYKFSHHQITVTNSDLYKWFDWLHNDIHRWLHVFDVATFLLQRPRLMITMKVFWSSTAYCRSKSSDWTLQVSSGAGLSLKNINWERISQFRIFAVHRLCIPFKDTRWSLNFYAS